MISAAATQDLVPEDAQISASLEAAVVEFSAPLYQFALGLTRSAADAGDLTQETFHIWLLKGWQVRDPKKIKSWLFTTLHREFLKQRRQGQRFMASAPEELAECAPAVGPDVVQQMDGTKVLRALDWVDELFRVPLTLFYLDGLSCREIAEIVGVPLGTVQSRISRGKDQLRQFLGIGPDNESLD
ncbi:MAG: RNA polymerase sigma factor [Verrucomicrobia bacterium]|nr:RNA polymerase sigma factor [Verrucomicrobiota bacterium]